MKQPSSLEELIAEFNAISSRAVELWNTSGGPCRPPASGWSLAQCLSHLTLSTNAYLPVWSDALSAPDLPRKEDSRRLRLDLWGRLLYWVLAPPPKFRFRTKDGFEAPSSPAALDQFLASQRELCEIVSRFEPFAIDRIKIASAYDPRVRYSIWSSFVTTAAHQQRHLWQAERIGAGGA